MVLVLLSFLVFHCISILSGAVPPLTKDAFANEIPANSRYEIFVAGLATRQVCPYPRIRKPDENGRKFSVRKFAKIPNFAGRPSNIVSTVHFQGNLYVCTSTSGGMIYKVTTAGVVSLFFNVMAAMASQGTPMDITNGQHGGLRSVAFHPNFRKNGFLYVSTMQRRNKPVQSLKYFSRPDKIDGLIPADSVVLEFKADKSRTRVIASSMRTVLRIGMPVYDHPVKQMMFRGKYLYIAHGDGSVQSAITGGGQRNDGLGKIIRINPLKGKKSAYSIPKSNPFKNVKEWKDELYAVGFRNPHNICFSKSGELFVTDAGRDNFEEINIVKAGRNYGWSLREGSFVHKESGGICTGVGWLPGDDERLGLEYPVIQVEHVGEVGANWVGQALAGSCPIENGSAMKGIILYSNFPTDGNLYYSFLGDVRRARTRGKPSQLTRAKTFKAKISFEGVVLDNLRDVVRREPGKSNSYRSDIRFGQGPKGEIYFSSKATGWIYLFIGSKK